MYDSYGRFNSIYQTHRYAMCIAAWWYARAWPAVARLLCYMHSHLVYEGACSDVTHTAFVLCCWNGKETPYQGPKVRRVAYSHGPLDPQVDEQCFRVMHMLR